jgi:hypothetical protein
VPITIPPEDAWVVDIAVAIMAVGVMAVGIMAVAAMAVGVMAVGAIVLTGATVAVAPVTGITEVGAAAGAQAARARDRITKKVPIRGNRFNFCCFIINLQLILPTKGGVNLTLVLYSKGKFVLHYPVIGQQLLFLGSPLLV